MTSVVSAGYSANPRRANTVGKYSVLDSPSLAYTKNSSSPESGSEPSFFVVVPET